MFVCFFFLRFFLFEVGFFLPCCCSSCRFDLSPSLSGRFFPSASFPGAFKSVLAYQREEPYFSAPLTKRKIHLSSSLSLKLSKLSSLLSLSLSLKTLKKKKKHQELCSGGELFDSIVDRGHYSERDAAAMTRTIVRVVAHCHSLGVVHRDLKPENFLLASKDTDEPTLKATDFGLSAFYRPGQIFTDVVGSAYYVAPEVLRRSYGKEADIWSCGVVLYIMLSGVPPFWGETEQQIFDSILKGELDLTSDPWPKISESAKDCVRRMLNPDPKKRATADEVSMKKES